MKALLIKVGFCDAFVCLLNTNEVREVAAMANFNLNETPRKKLLDGSTYIGARGGGQGGGRTSQGSLKQTLGRTRLMGLSGGDATPLDLLFDSDSAAASDCFVDISMPRTDLKVNPIGMERARNLLSTKNHPIRSPYEKVVGVSIQVCLCNPNLDPERERLGLYLLLAQK